METPQELERVAFFFKDGTVRFAEGLDAENWRERIDSALALAFVHGGSGQDETDWKELAPGTTLEEIAKALRLR